MGGPAATAPTGMTALITIATISDLTSERKKQMMLNRTEGVFAHLVDVAAFIDKVETSEWEEIPWAKIRASGSPEVFDISFHTLILHF